MISDAYPVIKILHASFALTALLLFIWRGRMSFSGRSLPRLWLRHIPDLVDTLLLGSGVTLVYISGQYPWVVDWVGVKLFAVLAYIALGFVALRFGRTIGVRRMAWAGALIVFVYIVLLAHFKEILPLAM